MNIETIIKSVAGKTAPDIRRVAEERFGAPWVAPEVQAQAKEIASARRQGQELIDVTTAKMSAETRAAAAADSAAKEQKVKQQEGRKQLGEAAKQVGGDVMTFGKAALGIPLSDQDVAALEVVGRGERKLPLQEAASAFAEMAKKMVEAAQERAKILQARGELKRTPLSRDQVLVDRMETAEEKVVESGLRIVAELDKEPRTLDNLREANAIHHSFDRAEKGVKGALGRLANRLKRRYPDTAEDIDAKKAAVEAELKGKKIEVTTSPEVTMEAKVAFVKETVDKLGIEGAETKKWFAEKLGLRAESLAAEAGAGAELLTVADGSLADLLLSVRTEREALTADAKKSLEAAKEDPRVADEALSFALLEYTSGRDEEIAAHKLEQLQTEAKTREAIRLQMEAAELSGSETWKSLVDAYDRTVSLLGKNVVVAGRVLGRAAGATGMVFGGAVAAVGGLMMIPGAIVAGAGVATAGTGFGAERLANRAFSGLREMVQQRREARGESRQDEITALEAQRAAIETKLANLRGGATAPGA